MTRNRMVSIPTEAYLEQRLEKLSDIHFCYKSLDEYSRISQNQHL